VIGRFSRSSEPEDTRVGSTVPAYD